MSDQTASSPAGPSPLVLPSALDGQPAENIDARAPAIRRPKRLAAIYGGTPFQHRTLNEPKYRKHIDEIIYLLDLPGVDLSEYDAVMIPDRMHPERLMAGQERIDRYLDQGGTVIVQVAGGLSPGTYKGYVTCSVPRAADSPGVVTVTYIQQ